MTTPLTNVVFAQQIGFMAKECASWSADMLIPHRPETLVEPVEPATLSRFLDAMAQRLDRLRHWSAPNPARPHDETALYRDALCGTDPSDGIRAVLVQRNLGVWTPTGGEPGRWTWNREALARLGLSDLKALYHTITSSPT